MERDGWFWCDANATNRTIKRAILKEMAAQMLSTLRGQRR
jgi:hypothetical protein